MNCKPTNYNSVRELGNPDLLPPPKSKSEMRQYLRDFLAQRDERKEILINFFRDNGYPFSYSIEDQQAVHDLVIYSEKLNPSTQKIDPKWIEVAWNLSLYLGDMIIEAIDTRKLKWDVIDVSIRKLKQPMCPQFVIKGFSDPNNDICPISVVRYWIRDHIDCQPKPYTMNGFLSGKINFARSISVGRSKYLQ